MDRLSSCYFCGTALDEPLQDYPLVAGDTGEHGALVTLCPGCHHKLETVLDIVVGEGEGPPALEDANRAVLEGESPAALTEPDDGGSGPEPIALGDGEQNDDEQSDSEQGGSAGDGGTSDAEGVSDVDDASGAPGVGEERDAQSAAATEAERDDPAEPDVEPLEADRIDSETATEAGAGEESSDETAGSPHDTDPEAGTDTDSTETDADRGTAAAGSGTADETGAAGRGGRDTGADSTGADAATANDTTDERGGTDPGREVTGTVSALEYNKVMRLLQNREFPVDRAEIEAVAASAYELSESECAAVIDMAVDRGLVVERDEQLVRPDG